MQTAVGAARRSLRHLGRVSHSAMYSGYQQANVVILPAHLADDFEAFCHKNPAPLPLLYRSQPGETSCPPLAKNANIRTDISQYCVYKEGRMVKTVSSLQGYSPESGSGSEQAADPGFWSSMVCFYQGCSFGFEGRLKEAGVPVRNVEQGRNVSMYRTSVPCVPAGVFRCPLVVTMRPVPAAMLDTVVEVTHLNPLAHGAPVHIGDPALLGIPDISSPHYGDGVELQPGDVPVFWACGVTAIEAVLSSKPPLAFSHSPGCMFLTDIPDSSTSTHKPLTCDGVDSSDPEMTPLSFLMSDHPLWYSLASKRSVEKIRQLETIIGEDPGQRGIKALFVQDELLRSCLALSHASSVAITTGFPTHFMHNPPDETDGPPGAIAIATMLMSLGKQVTMVIDKRDVEMNQAIIDEAVRKGVLKSAVPLVTFEGSGPDAALDFLCHNGDPSKPRYDHLLAIERSGRAADGNYYNMRAINIKHLVDPIDDLFIAAKNIPGITTTGVGDGGNELGMGKVREKVVNLMPKGDLIACDVPADYAITAGVSNWGGYAVACGLYLLHTCPSHQRYLKKGLGLTTSQDQLQDWIANLPSVDKEESILATLMDFGIRSGKTGNLAMEVDGLTFHPTHSDIIRRLVEATQG
ncbi:D-glutamate cyclase, mitochondrial [Notolabrus celidotus]|uniref:D-glutamate cyclase, mitochondrial n=1 Tax=Notolabrus celidotus TaxID=1203425 RepID=UPI0014903F1E|nr:D-glutamate cyclase, mitochondrial [Notolabrus celidotus]XP_034531840.1 D-glutamate cyclase, mitochondrial [Notolabrus celidotus]XP_034531841.1 D-glutamate cyclase, mitochondrial [Notolabrus celidotus]XP_034531842.1 D-glutamate cyclase, mitochondrial [Notolabrus celidotus]